MHTKIIPAVNAATAAYVKALTSLRDELAGQLRQIDAQIDACKDFALASAEPEPEPEPEPVKQSEELTESDEPMPDKFLQRWRDDRASAEGIAAVKRDVEGRPILNAEELARLESAITDGPDR